MAKSQTSTLPQLPRKIHWRPEVGFEPLLVTSAAVAAQDAARAKFGHLKDVPINDIVAVACEALCRSIMEGRVRFIVKHLIRHYEARPARMKYAKEFFAVAEFEAAERQRKLASSKKRKGRG